MQILLTELYRDLFRTHKDLNKSERDELFMQLIIKETSNMISTYEKTRKKKMKKSAKDYLYGYFALLGMEVIDNI